MCAWLSLQPPGDIQVTGFVVYNVSNEAAHPISPLIEIEECQSTRVFALSLCHKTRVRFLSIFRIPIVRSWAPVSTELAATQTFGCPKSFWPSPSARFQAYAQGPITKEG